MSKVKTFSFLAHIQKLNEVLTSNSRLAEDYANPSGIGDHREEGLIEILRSKLPSDFLLSKGEIVDSSGNRTSEFDVIIHLRSNTPQFLSLADRKVIPCEDVVCVGEVKSVGEKEGMLKFAENVRRLNSLNRYFKATEEYKTISKILGSANPDQIFSSPISCDKNERGVPGIMAFYFAYESPTIETVKKYFDGVALPSNLFAYFVLNAFSLLNQGGKLVGTAENLKPNVLLMLVTSLLQFTKDLDYRGKVRADIDRYFDHLTGV